MHLSQLLEPIAAEVPARHTAHAVGLEEYLPAMHFVQLAEPEAPAMVPEAQAEQATEPESG